ncbi:MAG: hypothetical protein KY475_13320, partial [Planctomycetes bacterium]|nr:hypothetical protein [Planctomycetota bacterium]
FSEVCIEPEGKPQAATRTLIRVVVRPRRNRDRRRRDAIDRARRLVSSVKSYLMAHDFPTQPRGDESRSDAPRSWRSMLGMD